jgi:molecular chaperone DnaK
MGIPPAPRGVPQIEVTFDIDANGIVSVHAKDKAHRQGTADQDPGLGRPVGFRHREDGQGRRGQFAEEDKTRREAAEAKNNAESLIHSTERQIIEHGDKVSEADKAAIETALDALKAALAEDNAETITARTADVMQASMKLGEAMYAASQAEAPTAEGGEQPAEAKKDDVIDADFKDVSDDKKKSA